MPALYSLPGQVGGKRLATGEGSEGCGSLRSHVLQRPAFDWRQAGEPWRVSPVAPSIPSTHPPPAPLTILPANERQEAGRDAWLLADLTFAASGSLPALEIILQLGVQVLRVGRGVEAPKPQDSQTSSETPRLCLPPLPGPPHTEGLACASIFRFHFYETTSSALA